MLTYKAQQSFATLSKAIEQYQKTLYSNRGYNFLVKQTEEFSLPFIESLILGCGILWLASSNVLPAFMGIFSVPIFAFGLAVLLIIPLNLLLAKLVMKYRKNALESSTIIPDARSYFQAKTQIWEDLFHQKATVIEIPTEREIETMVLENHIRTLVDGPNEILTQFTKDQTITVKETFSAVERFGRFLVLESETNIDQPVEKRLIVTRPFVFKCDQGNPKSMKRLLPAHSETLTLLKTITNMISDTQQSQVIVLRNSMWVVFDDIIAPSETTLEGYTLIPRLLNKLPSIFQ